jgi:hypothetical protein
MKEGGAEASSEEQQKGQKSILLEDFFGVSIGANSDE